MDAKTAREIDLMCTRHFFDEMYTGPGALIEYAGFTPEEDDLEGFPQDIREQVAVYKRDFCGKSRNPHIRKITLTENMMIEGLMMETILAFADGIED